MMSTAGLITKWTQPEIDKLFVSARRVLTHSIADIKVAPAQKSYGRLLLIIPAFIGKAHERNLVRRRCKALFYEQRLFEKGFDWIIFVKKPAIHAPFLEFSQVFAATVQKLSDHS